MQYEYTVLTRPSEKYPNRWKTLGRQKCSYSFQLRDKFRGSGVAYQLLHTIASSVVLQNVADAASSEGRSTTVCTISVLDVLIHGISSGFFRGCVRRSGNISIGQS